ncbi:MAG: tyrosine-type recombinase/integrase [Muribaculaceae bacterium]|nr:tyrosine-type recombinase/integrase [Muribaculaceae bacterium]
MDAAGQFIDYLIYELNRAPLTATAYANDLRQFKEWLSPNNPESVDFTAITQSDVRAWLASLSKKGITPRSLRRKIICLRSFFKWMIKTGKINSSPLHNISLPKLPKPLPELIKPQEIEEALFKINSDSSQDESPDEMLNSLVLEILYSLGLRRAELAAINDKDISFEKGEIKVTGKRSKQRVVPVPQKLMQQISCWQKMRDKTQQKQDPDNPLLTIKGKRITHHQIYAIVRKSLAESTAKKKSPHALRHSFASAMLNGGAEIDSVREFLGHASLSTTQIYTHVSLSEIKKAYTHSHPRGEKNIKG